MILFLFHTYSNRRRAPGLDLRSMEQSPAPLDSVTRYAL